MPPSRLWNLYGLAFSAAVIWSLYPVAIVLGGGKTSVWIQTAFMLLSYTGFFWIWLKTTSPEFVTVSSVKLACREMADSRWLLMLQRGGLPVYLLVSAHADPAVSAVLIETWSVFYFAAEFRGGSLTLRQRTWISSLLAFALIGVTGVVYAQYGRFGTEGLWAAAVVLCCSALQGGNVHTSMSHGRNIAASLSSRDAVPGAVLTVGLCCLLLGTAALAVHIWAALFAGGQWLPTARQIAWAAPVWGLLAPWGFIALRKLNHRRTEAEIGINLIFAAAVPLSLLWLAAAGTPIRNPQIMAAGTALIVAAALLGTLTGRNRPR